MAVLSNLSNRTKGFFGLLSSTTSRAFSSINYLESFMDVPEVNAVISAKANLFSSAHFRVVDDKLIEQTDDPFNKILQNPNWFQGAKEFLKQTSIFHDLYGNEFLYFLTPLGFTPTFDKVKALYTLPPNLISCEYKSDVPFFMNADGARSVFYGYKKDGKYEELPATHIVHLNDNRARFDFEKSFFTGTSKLKALKPVINNIKAAYESRGVILKSRGANGAWSPEASKDAVGPIALFPEEHEKLKEQFSKGFGTLEGQNQFIVSNIPMKFSQAGVNDPEKLGLFRETREGFNKILDSYGLHPDIFGSVQGATYENQKQALKGVYLRTIIPDANEWAYAINALLYKDSKKKVIADFTGTGIFNQDIKTRSEALSIFVNGLSRAYQDGAITGEEYREELVKLGAIKKQKQ